MDEQRRRISDLDQEIARLLQERAAVAQEIGRIKAESDRVAFDPAREAQVLAAVKSTPGPLGAASLGSIFQEIISACRALEQKLRVAFLGPEHTFTHLAARRAFGSQVEFAPQARIADIFQAVEAEQCHAGVVPVENSTGGVVPDTLDSLLETTARICGEILLPVHLAAMSHSSLDQVRTLYSHPNPLSQARMWLRDNLPSVDVKVMSSTTASAEAAAADDTGAALAPAPSAEAYGLQLLAENVEDEPSNRTRFFVLCPEPAEPTGRDKTSVVFSTSHRPGALHSAMGAFSQHGLNLTLIQSRPLRGQPWQYVFFVDLEGHQTDPGVKEALAELQEHCSFVKVLGSYPAQET